ncbi:uncharacterized protein BXZ73DRAFT_88835 [Epithele typhae]|uniref:uncharacterized protein n=1 Tax=Epithele typhae TaxID=378194 RepID=UPI002008DFAF|nr:uncharacterized protein BXZ73DRAFT_88835 [Epithele typhae]KAH9940145.1 hypothetical protein BXZ73DRAFT_88835 [Epithele typhae]
MLRDHFQREPPPHPRLEDLSFTITYWIKDLARAWAPVVSQLAVALRNPARYPAFRRLSVCKSIGVDYRAPPPSEDELAAARGICFWLFAGFARHSVRVAVDTELMYGRRVDDKIHDAAIVARWREEMVAHDCENVEREYWPPHGGLIKPWPRDPLSEAQITYIFDELRYEASRRDPTTGIFASAIRKVYESHSLVDGNLKEQLMRAASLFENVPEDEKDWHPGADGQVLDLVHPSLYPLCIGHSLLRIADPADGPPKLMLLDNDKYISSRPDLEEERDYAVSQAYQWLPTDFLVTALDYINNAHPFRHRALYPVVTSLVARFVPMFERVLSDVLSPNYKSIHESPHEWYDDVDVRSPVWDPEDNASSSKLWEAWAVQHKWPVIPEPEPFAPPSADGRVSFTLKGHTVQAIVKLANIHLTPEKPTYPGGSWHVEGMANERIVATGLYYYAMENVTESRLGFRMRVGGDDYGIDLKYEEDDHRGYVVAYGFGREDELNQPIGHIVAPEGKCFAFPNVYQHRVEPFELEDKTRPGHRKIVALFLVDPTIRVLSTSDVPSRQREWALAEVERAPAMQNLPQELYDEIVALAEGGWMSREEVEEHRLKLMAERSRFVTVHSRDSFEEFFDMCEH